MLLSSQALSATHKGGDMKPKLTYALATLIFAVALKPLIKTSLGASL